MIRPGSSWTDVQPTIRAVLHHQRDHGDIPPEGCAACDQDADQLARAGWFPFGTHILVDVRLEFSEDDESGLPLLERPVVVDKPNEKG